MSQASVLYRFHIDLSDITRSKYEQLDFRLAMHASESFPYLLTRMFAYVLNIDPQLEFSSEGLANPDDPCISHKDSMGGYHLWIEIGNPSAKRLHKAAKASRRVKVYTYKNPKGLLNELETGNIYQPDKIELFSLAPEFLETLENLLDRNNRWSIVHDHNSLMVNVGDQSVVGEIFTLSMP